MNFLDVLGAELEIHDLKSRVRGFSKAPSGYGYVAVPLHAVYKDHPDLPQVIERVRQKFGFRLIGDLKFINGFLNIDVNIVEYARLVLSSALSLSEHYGVCDKCPRGKYIIEHTSANPTKPMHLGHGRNAVLGDSLARLLRFCGASVRTHFYVNDCGDQMPYVGIGYYAARDIVHKRIAEGRKPDEIIGIIYTVTYAISEVKRLTRQIEQLTKEGKYDEVNRLIAERDEWIAVIGQHMERDRELVNALLEKLGRYEDLATLVRQWARAYEEGDEFVRGIIKEAVNLVLEGFKQTLSRLGIQFDSWDFESEVAVDNRGVDRVLRELMQKAPEYIEREDGAIVFRADKYAQDYNLWDELSLPRYIPKATLLRSDGTSLYLTRDIAYTLWIAENFEFDKLIRVIGSEQTHPQAQLRIALYAMGYRDLSKRVIHYSYEIVNIAGVKMSGRKGIYITLDSLLDEAKSKVMDIVRGRFPSEEVDKVAEAVAIGAVRFAFVSVSPTRPLTFRWEKVLDLNQNSGPFIQYTYVRTLGILEKTNERPQIPPPVPQGVSPEEKSLILLIGEFPEVIAKAAHELRLEDLTEYANRLALAFNSFYEKHRVIGAPDEVRGFRLALVSSVMTVLGNIMDILGIPRLRKM